MRRILMFTIMVSFGQLSYAVDGLSGYAMSTDTVSPYVTLDGSSQSFCFAVTDSKAKSERGKVSDIQKSVCVEGNAAATTSNMILNAIDHKKRVSVMYTGENEVLSISFPK